jgi:hypothetical protein
VRKKQATAVCMRSSRCLPGPCGHTPCMQACRHTGAEPSKHRWHLPLLVQAPSDNRATCGQASQVLRMNTRVCVLSALRELAHPTTAEVPGSTC